jgi:hypothetical protein
MNGFQMETIKVGNWQFAMCKKHEPKRLGYPGLGSFLSILFFLCRLGIAKEHCKLLIAHFLLEPGHKGTRCTLIFPVGISFGSNALFFSHRNTGNF